MSFGLRGVPAQTSGGFGRSGIDVSYEEKPGLLGLSLKNFLLNLITLSIYRFWAKTDVRRHVWSCVRINGEPLEYTGTGKELFLGALIVFLVLILPIIVAMTALQLYFGPEHWSVFLLQFFVVLAAFVLWGMAIYRARRYRLSRTLWRGIRGTMNGSSWSFSLLYFGAMLLRSVTLGWSTPAMNLNIQKRLIGEMEFGNRPFRFSGLAGPLYARYALCWFGVPIAMMLVVLAAAGGFIGLNFDALGDFLSEDLEDFGKAKPVAAFVLPLSLIFGAIVVYGVIWTFYTAREMVLFARYTGFEGAEFRLNATAMSLIGLWLGNLLITIFTLGIGQPYVVQRTMRYLAERLEVIGDIDVAAIQQSTAALDRTGEGLLDAFDVDAF